MCGICGGIDPAGISRETLVSMADALSHRGPDDEGYYTDGPVGFGFRRLSIIDLVHGGQPLSNEDGSVWIVFNGEIYNFPSLRSELLARGHRFSTRTDTEVIVHLYEEMGTRCVERLRGMFAFALWDEHDERLVLARDRLGQKPLFFLHDSNRLLFASEIKGLLAHPDIRPALNPLSLHTYLALRFVPSPDTLFDGISSLPPGEILTFQDGQVERQQYWDLSYQPKWNAGDRELTDRLDELIEDAVESHLISDVPLGTFLSGGIDSSLVSALVAGKAEADSPPAFTIGTRAQDFNELPLARRTADHLGLDHHSQVVEPDIVSLMPEMVRHLDMPGDPIAACQYFVAKLASRHVKVAIGGDGGDELFGGYDRYMGFPLVDYYQALPASIRRRAIGPLLDRLPDNFRYKNLVSKLRWLHRLSFFQGGTRYAEATTYFRFDPRLMEDLYGPRLESELREVDPRQPLIRAFGGADTEDLLDAMLYADATTRLPEHLLLLVDRMTMAQSVEGRLPLLDHHVAEFAARLPTDLKIKGRTLKYLLRRVAARHVPSEVTRAPKQGFMFPIARWLKDDLREGTRRLLLGSRLIEGGFLRAPAVKRLLDEHQAGKVDHHHRLWMLLNLEVWFRIYLDGTRVSQVGETLRRELALVESERTPA